MSAVLDRERRVTAGKRITFLAGQELENDEAFWTHDTWQEDNESFHSSDAASSADEDVFDSDFDESENDEEVNANEEMIGAAMEREIEQEERDNNSKKRSSAYIEVSNNKMGSNNKKAFGNGGRKPPRTGPNGKRVVGDGLNAGIVLNVPPQYQKNYVPGRPPLLPSSPQWNGPTQQTVSAPSTTLPLEPSISTNIADPTSQVNLHIDSTHSATNTSVLSIAPSQIPIQQPDTTVSFQLHPTSAKKKNSDPTLAATRIRRTSHENTTVSVGIRSRKSIKPIEKLSSTEKSTPTSNGLKRGKQAFTQEQLLLEAVQVTEPENERWILGQKRNQAMKDDIETQLRSNQNVDKNAKTIERFVSRRGYYNTISFLDMDHIPYILQRERPFTSTVEQESNRVCSITGKVAKFRDPKTGHGYFDIDAFRELRRRYEANQLPEIHTHGSTDVANHQDAMRVETSAVTGTNGPTTNDVPVGSMRAKSTSRSKSLPNQVGTKRRIATNRRKSNGKKMKESSATNSTVTTKPPGETLPVGEIMLEQVDKSSSSSRPRTTSTGGESINTPMKLHSSVYDYETLSHSNHSFEYPRNGIDTIGSTKIVSMSPPQSPGRKSPRVPKPTVKILESARAVIPSLIKQHPLLHLPQPILNTLDDDATKSSGFATAQPVNR